MHQCARVQFFPVKQIKKPFTVIKEQLLERNPFAAQLFSREDISPASPGVTQIFANSSDASPQDVTFISRPTHAGSSGAANHGCNITEEKMSEDLRKQEEHSLSSKTDVPGQVTSDHPPLRGKVSTAPSSSSQLPRLTDDTQGR